MYILTASYISCPERLHFLQLTANSVQAVIPEAKHVVSVFVEPEIDASLLETLPCQVVRQERKLTQFAQIDLLLEGLNLQDEDFVMLLDDDDLLIARPEIKQVLRSTQALYLGPDSQDNWTHLDLQRMLFKEYNDQAWTFVRDLSGYGCRYKYLRDGNHNKGVLFDNLADLSFMNLIDNLDEGLGFQRPYIFHRMHKHNGSKSDWLDGLEKDFLSSCSALLGAEPDKNTNEWLHDLLGNIPKEYIDHSANPLEGVSGEDFMSAFQQTTKQQSADFLFMEKTRSQEQEVERLARLALK